MHARPRRLIGPVLSWAGVVGVVALMQVWNPNKPSLFPACPWLTLTGFFCPGCGSTRAIHALAHADLGMAMQRNPLAVIVFAVFLAGLARWTWRAWRGEPLRNLAHPWVLWAVIAVIPAYWVARNIPGWTWLSPL